MKKLLNRGLLLIGTAALTLTLATAEGCKCDTAKQVMMNNDGKCGNSQKPEKCNGQKCDNSKKPENKCDSSKKAPAKSKCGKGKCGE